MEHADATVDGGQFARIGANRDRLLNRTGTVSADILEVHPAAQVERVTGLELLNGMPDCLPRSRLRSGALIVAADGIHISRWT